MFAALMLRQTSKIMRSRISQQSIRLRSRKNRFLASLRNEEDPPENKFSYGFEDNLRDAILKQTVVDWDKAHDELLPVIQKSSPYDFEGSFATAVFLVLTNSETFPHLRQFVEHVGLENLGITHITKYMRLCEDSDEILRCWKFLTSKNSSFTGTQAAQITYALLRTPEWRQSFKLLDKDALKKRRRLSGRIAGKLFEAQEYDEGTSYLRSIDGLIYIDEYTDALMEDVENAERFLKHMASVEARVFVAFDPSQSKSWNKHFGVKEARVLGGVCANCKTALPDGELNQEQFERLRKATRDQILHQGNIYLGSSPEEHERFEKFMKEHGPFDVIIDGLNLFYRFERPKEPIQIACREYEDKGVKRILILMRDHVLSSFKAMNLPQNVTLYCVANISKDDPYMLLAALMSHPGCRMLTTDIFRDHIYKLKKLQENNPTSDIYDIFEKWYITRKDHFVYRSFADDYPLLRMVRLAPSHFLIPFEDPNGWHFPTAFTPGAFPKWFCVRRRKRLSLAQRIK